MPSSSYSVAKIAKGDIDMLLRYLIDTSTIFYYCVVVQAKPINMCMVREPLVIVLYLLCSLRYRLYLYLYIYYILFFQGSSLFIF